MNTPTKWYTVREIDELHDLPKGSAFRCFKEVEPFLEEGEDYRVLHNERDRETIDGMRRDERIYPSSVNIILITADAYERAIKSRLTQI